MERVARWDEWRAPFKERWARLAAKGSSPGTRRPRRVNGSATLSPDSRSAVDGFQLVTQHCRFGYVVRRVLDVFKRLQTTGVPPFLQAPLRRCGLLVFRRCIVSRPGDVLKRCFSLSPDWITEVQKCADVGELENMLRNEYLLAKISFYTADNEPSKC